MGNHKVRKIFTFNRKPVAVADRTQEEILAERKQIRRDKLKRLLRRD